jgi:ABC-2 type transport system ATP-binding protein
MNIQIENLRHSYGTKEVLKGINLNIGESELFTILGPNGAGKTTLLKILSTLLPIQLGSALIGPWDLKKDIRSIQQILGISPQESAYGRNLSPEENLQTMGGLYGLSNVEIKNKTDELMEKLKLTEVAKTRAQKLSGGYKRRLSIAMALMNNPKVLFLDEPTLGLDPLARETLWELIQGIKENTTILLTTHYLEEADALSDRIAVLREGEIIAEGRAQELKSSEVKAHIRYSATSEHQSSMKNLRAALERNNLFHEESAGKAVLSSKSIDVHQLVKIFEEHHYNIDFFSMEKQSLDDVYRELIQNTEKEQVL